MSFAVRERCEWQLRTRSLALGRKTAIMGILNVTPDSFFDGGRFRGVEEAVAAALAMFEAGAAIVDIGGESTRPGRREELTIEAETGRVLPVVEGVLRAKPDALLSVDTYHAATAQAAVETGVEIVNDVSGFLWDGAMARTCAELHCGVVLMHTRGRPEEWKRLPALATEGVLSLVKSELRKRVQVALATGIAPERLVLDPGFGFGKAFESNYPLLGQLNKLRELGFPLLAGVSRKAFLGRTLAPLFGSQDAPTEARGTATIAAATAAVLNGADLVRVHDVRAAAEAVAIADAVLAAM